MSQSFEQFIARWTASGAAERANKDIFLAELCDVLNNDSKTFYGGGALVGSCWSSGGSGRGGSG